MKKECFRICLNDNNRSIRFKLRSILCKENLLRKLDKARKSNKSRF
ncbi:unnamed protein product [Paramecium sonneborni]|uniref:Uncharacterized protein n=1 Tax=Paramecium sonneborni TaxID=65129 RepID=A0A8S1Q5G9_9CILI|nr:unnamed protein product [Paramecium sonneborni]